MEQVKENPENLPVVVAGKIMTLDEYASLIKTRDSFIKSYLKRGKDFDKIRGWQKEGLLEPGAEKLCELFNLRPEFEIVRHQVDFDRTIPFISYWVKCTLYRKDTNKKMGDAIASCNTMEEKYRYRWLKKEELPPGVDPANLPSKKTSYGTKYRTVNEETGALDNTIVQIAEKRAYVAAVRKATQTSDRFVSGEEPFRNGGNKPVDAEYEEVPSGKPTTETEKPASPPPSGKITLSTQSIIVLSLAGLSEEEKQRIGLKLDLENPKKITEKDSFTEAEGQKVIKFISFRGRTKDLQEEINKHFKGDIEAVDLFCRESLNLNSTVIIDKLTLAQIELLEKALKERKESEEKRIKEEADNAW